MLNPLSYGMHCTDELQKDRNIDSDLKSFICVCNFPLTSRMQNIIFILRCCLMHVASWVWHVACVFHIALRCMLSIVCFILATEYSLLRVICCLLHVPCCMFRIRCVMLRVACGMLLVPVAWCRLSGFAFCVNFESNAAFSVAKTSSKLTNL